MSDLAFRTATELLADLAAGRVTSRELLDHVLARIERIDPEIGAVVTLDAEGARGQADAADAARARGEARGPLHGLPMTVKDCFETAGLRTTAGSPAYAEHVPERDAVAVARLRAAGAVVIGKTNTPALAMDWQTYNPLFGTTRNPWDPERTPGGSSGGSAAALAAGLVPLELGSDIGGSIRVPSHCCGVFGHKPSWGIVPERGHIPGPPGWRVEDDINVVGPLARSAEDLELALDVLAGPLPDRARAWRLALPPPRHESLSDYRIAAWLDDPYCPVGTEVRDVLEEAVAKLGRAGARVDARARPQTSLAEAHRLYRRLVTPLTARALGPEVLAGLRAAESALLAGGDPPSSGAGENASGAGSGDTAAESDPDDGPLRMAREALVRHIDWLEAHDEREALRARFADFFRDWDVLLCPVAPVPAFPHDHGEPLAERRLRVDGAQRPYTDLWKWMGPFGGALLPVTVAPVGRTRHGLPVGVQIVGPFLEDRTPLALARHLGERLGGFSPPPGV